MYSIKMFKLFSRLKQKIQKYSDIFLNFEPKHEMFLLIPEMLFQ